MDRPVVKRWLARGPRTIRGFVGKGRVRGRLSVDGCHEKTGSSPKDETIFVILHALWRARSTGGGGLLIASESRCCCQKFADRTDFGDSSGQKAVNEYGVSSLCRL